MLRWDEQMGAVSGIWKQDGESVILETRITCGIVQGKKTQIKKYLINGIPKRQLDFVGTIRVVLFWPEDLELVIDSPSVRRKYLDGVLMQVDREYRRNLFSYERGLRQRNRLLSNIKEGRASSSQLLFWNALLIKAGQYMTDKREQFLSAINAMQMGSAIYHAEYDKSIISETRLASYAFQEIAAQTTLVGPHRDDFIVYETIDGQPRDVSRYGSRGEQRLAVLWLKLAELEFIATHTKSRPMLLLDDIFSELDDEHKRMVMRVIEKQQTVITSADANIEHVLQAHEHEIIRL